MKGGRLTARGIRVRDAIRTTVLVAACMTVLVAAMSLNPWGA